METKAEYDVKSSAVYLRACTLKRVEDGWEVPSKGEILAVVGKTKLSAMELAGRLGVSRKLLNQWTIGADPIPFTAWVVLCQMTNQGFSRMWEGELDAETPAGQINVAPVINIAHEMNFGK